MKTVRIRYLVQEHGVGPVVAALLFACVSIAADQGASSGATDLVGRNGQFTVKGPSGKVETVDAKSLNMQKELMPSAPRGVITDADAESPAGESKPGEKTVPAKSAAAQQAAPKEETPEEKAIRAADVETLRQLRKIGGAYFYTEDNQPVSNEEIDRRIETGEVEGLKVIGLHLQDWEPETKSKDAPAEEASDTVEPGPVTPPILVPRLKEKENKKY
ncbi:MAG: hypothetical protein HUU46_05190 [Candidatus Hydrogenedentes bacterium]|nr:hypothetical protein [Candidatus Hydrogenedentota bacterium]